MLMVDAPPRGAEQYGKGAAMDIIAIRSARGLFNIPAHTHSWDEIILCKTGSGTIHLDTGSYAVGAGDIVCIPAGERHEDIASEARDNGVLTCTGALLGSFCILHDRNRAFETLFDLAADALLDGNPRQRAYIAALGDAMLHLLRYWLDGESAPVNEAVDAIDRKIRQNFSNPAFDLAGEIEKTGYCPSHFRRLFKAAYGRPPQAQLNHVRMEYAKLQMRLHRSCSVAQISQAAGFKDPYYFSRMFKLSEGMSPREFLRSLPE